jgi:hypothetical protein
MIASSSSSNQLLEMNLDRDGFERGVQPKKFKPLSRQGEGFGVREAL